MKTLKVLQGLGPRSFIAFIDEDNKVAKVSQDEFGPSPEVIWNEPQEAEVDEQGNEIMPGSEGGWEVVPTEDGMTYQMLDYMGKDIKVKEEECDVVKEVLSLFNSALEYEGPSRKKADECEKLYKGEHWTPAEKNLLEGLERNALSINFTEKNVDDICGHQIDQKTDIKYLPQEGGDGRLADLYSTVSKIVLDKCFYQREKAKVFKDIVVTGRGNFNTYVDYSKNFEGEIKVERFNWRDIVYGPHDKEDGSDLEYFVKHKMFSRSKIKQLWTDKADRIDEMFSSLSQGNDLPIAESVQYKYDHYAFNDNAVPAMMAGTPLLDIARREIRVMECHRREYKVVKVITSPLDEFYLNAEAWRKEDLDKVKTIPGFFIVNRSVEKIRVSTIAGNVVLKDYYQDDSEFFTSVPVYAKKDGADFWGKVWSVKDAQLAFNKRYSQGVDIGNKMVAYGWFYDQTTFPNDQEKHKFLRQSSSPGFAIEVAETSKPPISKEGVKFPSEISSLMQIDQQQISALMSIDVQPLGQYEASANFLQRYKQKLAGNQYLFANLDDAEVILGKILIKLIRKYYSPERIYRMISSQNARKEVQLAGQSFNEFSKEEIIELLSNDTAGEFDLIVSQTSYSPSVRIATLAMLAELSKNGTPIPPTAYIKLSELPEELKAELLQEVEQQNAQAAEAANTTAKMEENKTLIANGIIPGEVQQRLNEEQKAIQPQQPTQTDQVPVAPQQEPLAGNF